MYICVCNGITESQVRTSVRAGATTLEDLQFELGVATCCGSCATAAGHYLPGGAHCDHHCAEQHGCESALAMVEATAVVERVSTRRIPIHAIPQAA